MMPLAIIALAHLAMGVAIGWWIWRSHPEAEAAEPTLTLPAEEARDLLNRVNGVVRGIAEGVGEHSTGVATINQELQSLGSGDGGGLDMVVGAITQIIEANSKLQGRLSSAEVLLREQAEMIESFMAEARTDALTSLPNRRAFEDELNRRFAQWKRSGRPLSLMVIDIDHFKRFNDGYGHQMGDVVLRGVAEVLAKSVREMDMVARYGGEEFCAILPDTNMFNAMNAAERSRLAVDASTFATGKYKFHVSVSIGVAEILADEEMASLVKRADQALYKAKEEGRNRSHYHDGQSIEPVSVSLPKPEPHVYLC